MEEFVIRDNKKLRRGFTTGTCAAAAAQGAAVRALSGRDCSSAGLITPKGITLTLPLGQDEGGQLLESMSREAISSEDQETEKPLVESESWPGFRAAEPALFPPSDTAVCYVKKYSGDDPDVTNGILVFARVTLYPLERSAPDRPSGIDGEVLDRIMGQAQSKGASVTHANGVTLILDGGIGVGRVTKPGLACPIGHAAINPTPRRMIEVEVRRVAEELDYQGVIQVVVSIPQGIQVAKRTYNPRLGIQGGISVLGTSGIVEPMSEQALIDTVKVEMNMRCAEGANYLLLTPGNYGETFLKETMGLGHIYTVQCSNFLGDTLEYAEEKGLKGVLLVSHIGKLIKVAGGIMNTHSKYGDARLEILSAHAALQGADRETIHQLMQAVTTDEGIAILDRQNLREQTIRSVLQKVQYHLEEKVHHSMKVGAVMFSNKFGYLGQTEAAAELISLL